MNLFEHNGPEFKNEVKVTKRFSTKPKVFLVQVNRFKLDKQNQIRKIMDKVKVVNETKVEEAVYNIDSTINHEGNSVETGHCVANIYNFKQNKFFRCSDSVITKKNLNKSEQIYVAVLKKKKESENKTTEDKESDISDI